MPKSGYSCSSVPQVKVLSKKITRDDAWHAYQSEVEHLLDGLLGDIEHDIANALALSCATKTSLSTGCGDHHGLPDRHVVTKALSQVSLEAWEARANAALQAHLAIIKSKRLRRNLTLAIDTHKRSFHGISLDDKPMEEIVRRGRPKDGTKLFFEYATLAIMVNDRRLTIAVRLMRPGERKATLLHAMRKEAEKLGLRARLLLFDAWFSDSFVVEWCRDNLPLSRMTVLMPLQIRGKKGQRVLQTRGRKRTWYEFTSVREEKGGKVKKTVRVQVHVLVTQARGRRRGKRRGLAKHGFIVLGRSVPLRTTRELYHRRSAIEKTYALLEKVVPRTTSKSAGLRFALVLVSLIAQNVWTWLRWERASVPRRGPGGRTVLERAFEYLTFVRFIAQYAASVFDAVTEIMVYWQKGRSDKRLVVRR